MRERKPNMIRAWLKARRLTVLGVARRARVCNTIAHRTINGEINNRRILRELVRLGCPGRYLDLPGEMQGREAA
mgnify:CR=1 FL=1